MPGIAAFLLSHWRAVTVLLIVLALAGYIETLRLERDHAYSRETKAKAELATFKAEVAVLGEQAKKAAAAKEAADKDRKEKADAEHDTTVAALNARVASLRNARSGRSILPTTASCPERPAAACLDRAILERALRTLDQDVQGLVDEGSRATVDLDTAKRWARGSP